MWFEIAAFDTVFCVFNPSANKVGDWFLKRDFGFRITLARSVTWMWCFLAFGIVTLI